MFRGEPEGCYRCTKSMAIAPFWFSTEHLLILIAPFYLSTDDMFSCCYKTHTFSLMPNCGMYKNETTDCRVFGVYNVHKVKGIHFFISQGITLTSCFDRDMLSRCCVWSRFKFCYYYPTLESRPIVFWAADNSVCTIQCSVCEINGGVGRYVNL